MPTFTAEERNAPNAAAKPGDGPPICPTPYLPNMIDNVGTVFFEHRHKTHTVRDVIRPGYFNPLREMLAQQLRAGECFIRCVLGAREDGFTVVDLAVIQAKQDPGVDILVAKGRSEHFTPVRHDGTLAEDDDTPTTKGRKAA